MRKTQKWSGPSAGLKEGFPKQDITEWRTLKEEMLEFTLVIGFRNSIAS